MHQNHNFSIYAALAGTMLIWGVSFVATKYLLGFMTPITYMAVRFAVAAVLFTGILMYYGLPRFNRRVHLLVLVTALAEPVAYFIFESYGLNFTTASKASLIIATIPVMVMVAARVFLGEPVSTRGIWSVVVSMAGIALVVLGDPDVSLSQPGSMVGDLLVFGAVISASTYITMARHVGKTNSTVHITAMQILYGALVFVILWLFQSPDAKRMSLDGAGWAALLFLAGGATIGAFLLYNYALSHVHAGEAALFINAIPVITAITARFFLNERLSVVQISGAVLVIAAVTWSRRPQRVT